MANAFKAFRSIQISNVEDTPGSAEAATHIMLGTITPMYSDKVIHYPEQERGGLSKHYGDDFVVGKEVQLSFEGEMNMNDIIFMMSNSIRGNITATQPDSTNQPNAYLWTFQPGLTTANTPEITNGIDTYTIEYGDNVQFYEAPYLFTRTLTISGAPNEPIMVTWDVTGSQVTETTKTGSLTVTATQYFPFNLAKFYIDTSYAGIGGTQVTKLLKGFTWTLETMFTPRYTADGGLIYTAINEDKKSVKLELSYLRDGTNSEGEKNKYDARSTTYLRIACLGATELDSGQSNVPYVYLDGAFRYTEWPEADDEDGAVVETVTAESVYDSSGAMEYETAVLTTLAALP